MKVEVMRSIPSSRAEFERNMFLMREKMRDGKIHIAPDLNHSIHGILRVRKLPNSRIDLLSIDEMARVHANMIANMEFEGNIASRMQDADPDELSESEGS